MTTAPVETNINLNPSKSFRRVAIVIFLLAFTFVAIYLAWYFVIMRDDFEYLFVWSHAFSSAPDYPPSIIMMLTIVSFAVLWLTILAVSAIVRIRKRRQRRSTRGNNGV